MLTEHLWSGIIHRSETGETRKEDSVDLLDLKGFTEYIQNHYEIPSTNGGTVAGYSKTLFLIQLINQKRKSAWITKRKNTPFIFSTDEPIIADKVGQKYSLTPTETKTLFLFDDEKSSYKNYELNDVINNNDVLKFLNDCISIITKLNKYNLDDIIKKVKN